MKTQDSNDFSEQSKVDQEGDKNNDQTWGRTNNEAYVWENEGQQEHHHHLDKQSGRRSDVSMQEDISKVLTSDNLMDASNILVEVNKGVAKLTGSVSEQNEKERAEELAKAIPGVLNIENQIFAGAEKSKDSSEHHYKTLIHSSSSSPKSVF